MWCFFLRCSLEAADTSDDSEASEPLWLPSDELHDARSLFRDLPSECCALLGLGAGKGERPLAVGEQRWSLQGADGGSGTRTFRRGRHERLQGPAAGQVLDLAPEELAVLHQVLHLPLQRGDALLLALQHALQLGDGQQHPRREAVGVRGGCGRKRSHAAVTAPGARLGRLGALLPDMALLGVSSCTASDATAVWQPSHLMMRRSSCSCFSQAAEASRSLQRTELESISMQGEKPDGSWCHTDAIARDLGGKNRSLLQLCGVLIVYELLMESSPWFHLPTFPKT